MDTIRFSLNNTLVFLIVFLFFSFVIIPSTNAQDTGQTQSLFYIAPIVEAVYSRTGLAFGGGIAMNGGDSVNIGVRVVYFVDTESVHALEVAVFMRFFIFRSHAESGFFVQANAGGIAFIRNETVSLPTDIGSFSAFLSAGWRFLFGRRFFFEPIIRAGYPYTIGTGVIGGVRF